MIARQMPRPNPIPSDFVVKKGSNIRALFISSIPVPESSTVITTAEGRTTSQLLHRFILNVTDPEIDVDHQDHNGLNCQRSNLRKCVRGENDGNRRKTRGRSQYRGVSWSKGKGMWRACITIDVRTVHLGYFADEVKAAQAYDDAARIRFGVFAKCNFPLQE